MKPIQVLYTSTSRVDRKHRIPQSHREVTKNNTETSNVNLTHTTCDQAYKEGVKIRRSHMKVSQFYLNNFKPATQAIPIICR